MEVPAPWSEKDFADLLADPAVFLAQPFIGPEISRGARGAEPLAFALGRVALDEAELLTIAVHRDVRRRGLGAETLAAFEAAARGRSASRAFLEVAATNAPARALYARAGWSEDGVRRAYYRAASGRIDAILMSKTLAPA
ncbi:GNAT family N-acetyltransferase [Silicimonas algicola]|nr:GNAT family N-acetyltransferase [Silicimonas algicola]